MALGVQMQPIHLDQGLPTLVTDLRSEKTNSKTIDGFAHMTSLPPLPQYIDTVPEDKVWGEDNIIQRQFIDLIKYGGINKHRNNFDNCHPIEDVFDGKWDAQKFPKPLQEHISKLASSSKAAARRVSRVSKFELFPSNNTYRRSKDGGYVLLDRTRASLDEYKNRLYCTSKNSRIFTDTSDHMKRRIERDVKYIMNNPKSNRPTCNVICHPDPCHLCWNGDSTNRLFFQRKVIGEQAPAKSYPIRIENPLLKVSGKGYGNISSNSKTVKDQDVPRKQTESSHTANPEDSNNPFTNQSDGFGPWAEVTVEDDSSPFVLVPNLLHNSGSPQQEQSTCQGQGICDGCSICSKNRCPESVNMDPGETEPSGEDNAETVTNCGGSACKWNCGTVCRCISMPKCTPTDHAIQSSQSDSTACRLLPKCPIIAKREAEFSCHCNRWSNRDGNNLRIPCMSYVIGTLQKSTFHKRFHSDHPEIVPDLRDFVRYSKRVSFSGYNTSVFR